MCLPSHLLWSWDRAITRFLFCEINLRFLAKVGEGTWEFNHFLNLLSMDPPVGSLAPYAPCSSALLSESFQASESRLGWLSGSLWQALAVVIYQLWSFLLRLSSLQILPDVFFPQWTPFFVEITHTHTHTPHDSWVGYEEGAEIYTCAQGTTFN